MLQLTNSFNAKHIHIYPPKFHQNVLNQNMFSEFLKAGNPTSQDLRHWDPTTSPGRPCWSLRQWDHYPGDSPHRCHPGCSYALTMDFRLKIGWDSRKCGLSLDDFCAHMCPSFWNQIRYFSKALHGYWSSWARFEMRTCPGEDCTGSHFAWLAESHGFGNRNYPCFLYVQARLWVSTSRFNFVLLLY